MSTVSLTGNEVEALTICLNYADRASQLGDNFSNGGPEEFAPIFDGNMQAVGGLIRSLEKKGLAISDEEDPRMVWITEAGVHAIFDHIEAEASFA